MRNKRRSLQIILILVSSGVIGSKLPELPSRDVPILTTTKSSIPTPPLTIITRTTTTTTEPIPTTTEEITTTTERSLPDDFCEGINFAILPHPDYCTKYVICIYEVSIVITCGSYEVFYNESCVQGDPETCEAFTETIPTTTEKLTSSISVTSTTTTEPTTTKEITTTTSSTTTSTPTTTTVWSPPNDFCNETTYGVFPHPDNCFQFVVCTNYIASIVNCKVNEVFYNGACVEGDPSTCEVFTTTTTTTEPTSTTSTTTSTPTTTTTTTESSLPNDFCNGINFGRFPHPNNCFQSVVCINEVASIVNCGSAEIFYNGVCVEGDPITCEVFAISTTHS